MFWSLEIRGIASKENAETPLAAMDLISWTFEIIDEWALDLYSWASSLRRQKDLFSIKHQLLSLNYKALIFCIPNPWRRNLTQHLPQQWFQFFFAIKSLAILGDILTRLSRFWVCFTIPNFISERVYVLCKIRNIFRSKSLYLWAFSLLKLSKGEGKWVGWNSSFQIFNV